jgi:hypothetical protein
MIRCSHKNVMVDLNRGVVTEMCLLHGKFVDDVICGDCSDCEDCDPKHIEDFHFPRRSEEELSAVSKVCAGCPLRNVGTGRCQRMTGELLPILTLNQHPSTHCPEGNY